MQGNPCKEVMNSVLLESCKGRLANENEIFQCKHCTQTQTFKSKCNVKRHETKSCKNRRSGVWSPLEPNCSFYPQVTEINCLYRQRNLTCFWFVSSTQNYRGNSKFPPYSLWVIFRPQTRYKNWVAPHLDDGPAKIFEISCAWGLTNFISQNIHFLSAWVTLLNGQNT